MSRLLVIVSQDKPALYDSLKQTYSRVKGVHVILDRRENGTRQPSQLEGHWAERRSQPNIDAEMLVRREVGSATTPAIREPARAFADTDLTAYAGLRPTQEVALLPYPGLAP